MFHPTKTMADSANAKFFSSSTFSASQYRQLRDTYPKQLYETLLEYHDETGGERDFCIDLGCGPGTATIDLSAFFLNVIGIDLSEPMITEGRNYLVESSTNGNIKGKIEFKVGSAESLPFLQDGSVDLVAAGTAVHWFPEIWWNEAQRVLKPNGTVALFAHGPPSLLSECHPTPVNIYPITEEIRNHPSFTKFSSEGRKLALNGYENLPLPTSIGAEDSKWKEVIKKKESELGLNTDELEWRTFKAKEWVYKRFSTITAYGRWKEANPDLVGTPEDPVEAGYKLFKEKLSIKSDEEEIQIHRDWILLLVKRSNN